MCARALARVCVCAYRWKLKGKHCYAELCEHCSTQCTAVPECRTTVLLCNTSVLQIHIFTERNNSFFVTVSQQLGYLFTSMAPRKD